MKRASGAVCTAAAMVLVSGTVVAADAPVTSAALTATTMQRLLIADGVRVGERIVAVGDRGYIVLSDDRGKTWRRASSPTAPLLTAVRFVDDKHGWAVGHDSIILATVDGGQTWARQFSAPAEQRPLLSVLFLDTRRGYAAGAYGAFYETTDGGAKWSPRKVVADDKHLNALVDAGNGTLLILGEAGTLLRSTDSGANWQAVTSPYKGSFFGAVSAKDGSIAAFGLRGRIYRSTDAGRNWMAVENPSTFSIMNGTLMPDGAVVLAGGAGTVLMSRDNGQSFKPIASGIRGVLAKALPASPEAILLLGESGVRELPVRSQAP